MARNIWPASAVSGAPAYSGRMIRQSLSALFGGASPARPLGARSGVRPGSGTLVTATSTTWTVNPHAGVLDLEASASSGPYTYSIDAAVSGTVAAASATNPRVDIVYVTLNDPAESDGSSTPDVVPGYLAGTPAGSPVAPATPARSMVLHTISVPVSGGGSPSTVAVAPFCASAGPFQVRTLAELNALSAYEGLEAFCLFDSSRAVYANGRWVFFDTKRQDYTTVWTDNAGATLNPGSGGSLSASYWRKGASAAIRIAVTFSPTGAGIQTGGGGFKFTMPWTLSGSELEATLLVKSYAPNAGGNFAGSAYVTVGTNIAKPLLPFNRAGSALGDASNADSTLATGTGVPQAINLAQYTWGATGGGSGGGSLTIYGDYPY